MCPQPCGTKPMAFDERKKNTERNIKRHDPAPDNTRRGAKRTLVTNTPVNPGSARTGHRYSTPQSGHAADTSATSHQSPKRASPAERQDNAEPTRHLRRKGKHSPDVDLVRLLPLHLLLELLLVREALVPARITAHRRSGSAAGAAGAARNNGTTMDTAAV